MPTIDLNNTKNGFAGYTDSELRKSLLLFRMIANPNLARFGPKIASLSLKLGFPVRSLIKDSLFGQFCGGETLEECLPKIEKLGANGVGTILDFATEAVTDEEGFDRVFEHVAETVELAGKNPHVPFAVFKPTGLGDSRILTKVDAGETLNPKENRAYERFLERCHDLCKLASERKVKILIDAEESWFQDTVDEMATNMMQAFNQSEFVVYNTLQMYRHDRFDYLKRLAVHARKEGFRLGFKLVRGAYLEKETDYAEENGLPNPMQSSKQATDNDFNLASEYCLDHIDEIAFCAGTHNDVSIEKIVSRMQSLKIAPDDTRVYFAQLYGMSDNLSFNLSRSGYLACKYLPFGKLEELLPYLARRAQENSSLKGQTGRELAMIQEELKRRSL